MARYVMKPTVVEAVENTGEWAPIIEWLDELVQGTYSVPFGSVPHITRKPDGELMVRSHDEELVPVPIGGWIIFHDSTFYVYSHADFKENFDAA